MLYFAYGFIDKRKISYYIASETTKTLFTEAYTSDDNVGTSDTKVGTSDAITNIDDIQLPDRLKQAIKELRARESCDKLSDLLEEVCSYMPLSIDEIGLVFNRNKEYMWRRVVKPLKREGRLAFTHHEMINHPEQKYKIGLNSKYYKEQQ